MATVYPGSRQDLIRPPFPSLQENQIRLIRILPAERNHYAIVCTSEAVTLEPDLRYVALTNVPHKPERRRLPIMVNGHTVSVDDSLNVALLYIRNNRVLYAAESGEVEILPLWVHSISVNNTDQWEISQQVSLFGPLLEGAYKVLCWLGPQEIQHGVDAGEKAICAIRKIAESAFGGNNTLDLLNLRELFLTRPNLSMPMEGTSLPIDWEAIFDLFGLPFWSGTWTAQAMVLVNSPGNLFLVYGNEGITWGRVSQFLKVLDKIKDVTMRRSDFLLSIPLKDLIRKSEACDRANHIRLMRNQWTRSGSVAPGQIFKFSLGCVSRHPNHYVYGFQAISSRKVTMDYYWNTAAAYIQWFDHVLEENDTVILAYASGVFPDNDTHPETSNLPSWVPNLASCHKSTPASLITPYWGSCDPPFSGPREYIDYSDKTLHIHGVRLHDRVTRSFRFFPTNMARDTQLALNCLHIISLVADHPSDIPLLQAFFHTLISVLKLDQDRNTFPLRCLGTTVEHLTQITADGFGALHRNLPLPAGPRDVAMEVHQQFHHVATRIMITQNVEMLPEGRAPTQAEVLEHMGQLSRSAVFLTRKGYIGIGPVGLSVGDEVCILNACSSAMLMRSVQNSPNFMNVGACYMYGLSSQSIKELIRSGETEVDELTIQ